MGFFGGYGNAGPGVAKNTAQKRSFFKFLEVYFRRFWKLIPLNLLFLVFCIPVVTIGPATAGITKVCRNFTQERNAFIWGDFIDSFKKNFKQSFLMGLIDIVVAGISVAGISVYGQLAAQQKIFLIPMAIYLGCMLIFLMMHFYIYPMIVSTTLSFKQIFKNSFLLVSIGAKKSLITLVIIVVSVLLTLLLAMAYTTLAVALLMVLLWVFSFNFFVISFNCFPVIRAHVIEPYYKKLGEDNPEFSYLKTDADAVFADKGGTEAPVVEPKKKSGGKRIS
ncbi:MAG: DUF624 domain-containing protein [Oscillospiraceae bacterium]